MVKTNIDVAPIINAILALDPDKFGTKMNLLANNPIPLSNEQIDDIRDEIERWRAFCISYNNATATNNVNVFEYCGCVQEGKTMACSNQKNIESILTAQAILQSYKSKLVEFFSNRSNTVKSMKGNKRVTDSSINHEQRDVYLLNELLESSKDPLPQALSFFSKVK